MRQLYPWQVDSGNWMVLDNLRMLIKVTRRISVLLELRNKDGEF